MGWSPYYPAGVTDEMIEQYFGDNGACCALCAYYNYGACQKKEDALLDDYTINEIEEMDNEEYSSLVSVDSDDCCDDFEGKEEEIPDYIEDSWKDEW